MRGVPSSLTVAKVGIYQLNNPQPFSGSFNVKEEYLEVGVPLLKDLSFAQSLNLDAAVRHADYSQAGGVTTWKYGLNYLVVDDFRLRGTVSQDIRAPNILELFNSETQSNQTGVYNSKTTQIRVISSGNPDLVPEEALTWTYGAVLRPRWIEGLQASVDYYRIGITKAIGSLPFQTAINQCAAGNQTSCALITVNPDGTLIIHTPAQNLSVMETAGYDMEADYNTPLFDGSLALRLLGNHLMSSYTISPGATTRTQTLGSPSSPSWKGTFSATYSQDSWSLFAQERYIGAAVIDPTMVQGVGLQLNNIPAVFYTDVTVKYRFQVAPLGGGDQELFFTINNAFNKQPPISGGNPTNFSVPINFAYDAMGRYFSVGLRVSVD